MCCDSWGRKEPDTTERLIRSDLINIKYGSMKVDILLVSNKWNILTLTWLVQHIALQRCIN